MLHGAQRGMFELDFCVPSECADRLAAGLADIGIVPSVELPRLGLEVIPGAGIASEGPVRSILLVTKVAPAQVRRLAADSNSRTSVMLSRILLSRQYGARPEIVSMAPDFPSMIEDADAALLIGDSALRLQLENLPFEVIDLGAEWTAMTGLPMVFAVWAGRKGCAGEEVTRAFMDSCRFGLSAIDEIARTSAESHGVSEALARQYLTENIRLELNEREYEGLRRYLQYAAEFAIVAPTGIVSA